MEFPEITVELLKSSLKDQITHEGIEDEQLQELVTLINKGEQKGRDAVDAALSFYDNLFNNYGIEAINDQSAEPSDRSYYFDIAMLYSNTGETYNLTLAYDTEYDKFLLTSWGDWFEEFEREKDIRYDDDGHRVYAKDEPEDDSEELEEEFKRQFSKTYEEYLNEQDDMNRNLINEEAFAGDESESGDAESGDDGWEDIKAGYRKEISSWDWEGIKADCYDGAEEDDFGDRMGSAYLGSVLALSPSGKYYTEFTTNQNSRDEFLDSAFYEALDEVAEENGGSVGSGEGDPTDLFFFMHLEDEEEDDGDGDDSEIVNDKDEDYERSSHNPNHTELEFERKNRKGKVLNEKRSLINEDEFAEHDGEEAECVLDSIPDETIEFVVPTERLCKEFGYPSPDSLSDSIMHSETSYCSRDGLDDVSGLNVTKCDDLDEYDFSDEERDIFEEEGYCYLDKDDKVISWDVVDEICQAVNDAIQMGTEGRAFHSLESGLESILQNFSNYKYSYDAMGNSGYVGYQGTAKGFQSMSIKFDDTTIRVNLDFVHIINDCLSGVGMFSPDCDLEGETPKDFIESRWGHISSYGEIYGQNIVPELEYEEDFDRKFFAQELDTIEKSHDLRLK